MVHFTDVGKSHQILEEKKGLHYKKSKVIKPGQDIIYLFKRLKQDIKKSLH